jgi:amino acid adenylation domain-containing protein
LTETTNRLVPDALPAGAAGHWFTARLHPQAPLGNAAVSVELTGPLQPAALAGAIASLVDDHPELRWSVAETAGGVPVATVSAEPIPLHFADVTPDGLPEAIARHIGVPVPPDGPDGLLRAHLFSLGGRRHVLTMLTHRIAADELRLETLVAEVAARYADAPLPPPAPAPVLPSGAVVTRLELPGDRPRPAANSFRAGQVTAELPARHDPDVVVTAFLAVLARYSGQTGFSAGIRRDGRLRAVTVELPDTVAFTELVRLVTAATDAGTDPDTPTPGRPDPNRHPRFDVIADVTGQDPVTAGWPADLTARRVEHPPAALAADLRLAVRGTAIALSYAQDLFDPPRMHRLLGHLRVLLDAIGAGADPPLPDLPLLTVPEREDLLRHWQGVTMPYDRRPVHHQIVEQARRQPDRTAAKLGDDELTYGELDRRSDDLARYLASTGVGQEEIVGVALTRGLDVFVALLGVLKAGAAFVVLDPTHPANRLEYMLHDASVNVLLTRSALLGAMPDGPWRTVALDGDRELIESAAAAHPDPVDDRSGHDTLAYVLYTSGSTGRPKGVLIEHGALSNFLRWLSWVFDLGPGSRMAQHMTLVFDFAQGEIFTALSSGATMVLVPDAQRTSPDAIGALLAAERINYLGGPPAVLSRIPDGDYPDLRYVLAGGEAFPGDLVNRWAQPPRRFVNGYGPTEAAVGCIYYDCPPIGWVGTPPIGRAMPNRTAYVVDRWDRLAPIGTQGEILTGAAGLARGYLNQPELTADRFIDDPVQPGRVYRTGDLGVWTEDGQIQFLGRIDTQVKLNGLRIELEEIESVLAGHAGVKEAAVALRHDTTGAARLVGFVVPAEPGGAAPSADELRSHLAADLPTYMVPGQFVVLDALPLTTVGKVDRKVLPAGAGSAGASAFVPPRTPLERVVADEFAQVLSVTVGVDDDFFAAGGDQAGALRLLARIRSATGAGPSVAQFLAEPTVTAVTAVLTGTAPAPSSAPWPSPSSSPPSPPSDVDELALLAEIEALSDEEIERLLATGDGADG